MKAVHWFRYIMFPLTILLTFLSSLTFGQSKETYQRIGDSLSAIGQYDQLIRYFEGELKKHPKSVDILRWLGYIHIEKNNLDLGEKYYTDALQVNPKCTRCYLNIGKVYSLRGDNKKALEYFDKAVETDPNDGLNYSSRAKLKEMLGDKFGALQDHNKAIEIDPQNADYYVQRGIYNSNSGYQSLAISDFTKAIESEPGNHYPYFQRASAYYGQQRMDEAMADINKAIELDSMQYYLYTGRGAIFEVNKEYGKAIQDYNKAISLNKEDILPYMNRATANYKMEDLDASCSDYLTLKIFIEEGKISDQSLISEINASIKDICDSTRPSYFYQRGVGYYNLKEYKKALDIYDKGLQYFPDNAMMFSFKGNALLALNEYEKAIQQFQLSLKYKENILSEVKANPRFANASDEKIRTFYNGSLASTYFSISECKINLGLVDEALVEINRAIELAPDIKEFNKEAYFNMRGHIYLIKRKFELAIVDFNKSIQLNKNFTLAYVNRAIAKVSIEEKVQLSSYSFQGKINNQPMGVNWDSPSNTTLKRSEANLLSALADCNVAIEIDKDLGFAYYIRGQIKQMLNHRDYCIDLLAAQKLGLNVESKLLNNCSK